MDKSDYNFNGDKIIIDNEEKLEEDTINSQVWHLIEQYCVHQLNLYPDRSQIHDAVDRDGFYEIKSTISDSGQFILRREQHERLLQRDGKYIFIEARFVFGDVFIRDVEYWEADRVDRQIDNDGWYENNGEKKYNIESRRIRWNKPFETL